MPAEVTGTGGPRPAPPLAPSTGRHPRDLGRLVAAAAIVALGALAARARPVNALEVDIYRQIGQLPTWSRPGWRFVELLGSVGAIGVAAATAFFFRRFRLGIKVILGATLAWGLTAVIDGLVAPRPVPLTLVASFRTFHFPAQHVALAAAMATIATPYLRRPLRRLGWPVVALVALADVYLGHHLPLDVVTGAFLGWWSGTALHLAAGAPGRRTSPASVRLAMDAAGLAPRDVVTVRASLWGPTCFSVTTAAGGQLEAEVVRRGQRRAGWWYQARRFMASLEVEDEPRLGTPTHEVEHEALVSLLAERGGVQTPSVVLAQELGHGPALLVRRPVQGRTLDQLAGHELDDALVDRIWGQVQRLGRAGIAHHDLRTANVVVGDDGRPWILDFAFARAGASPSRLAQDVAEMLVSLASVGGTSLAVDSAVRALAPSRLQEALSYLHPLALPARIRRQCGGHRVVMGDLRTALAERLGCSVPSFKPRVRRSTILALIVGGGAVYLLLPQIGTFPALLHAVRRANYWWLVGALACGLATFPMAAASYIGAVGRKLPFGLTTVTQMAAAFTSRLTPGGLGGIGLNVIYLERRGLSRPEAIGSVALNQTAGVVVHATAFFVAVGLLGTSGVLGRVKPPSTWIILLAVVGVLVGAGFLLGSPFGRRRLLQPGLRVGRDLLSVLRRPTRALALFGGSAGVTLGNGLALATSLAAFDTHVAVPTVLAVYIGGSALASPAPTPGNLGALEAALVAGLTSVGIAAEPAVAAVLTFRLLTFWFPIAPGLVTFRILQHRGLV